MGETSDLGEASLVVGGDAEAGDAGGREAGAVGELLHSTDLGHGKPLFLLLFGKRRQDLHIVLLL